MLNVQLDEIKDSGLSLEGEVAPGEFPQLAEMVAAGEATFPEQVKYRIEISRLIDMIEVAGHIESVLELKCGRCLESYQMPFSSDFFLTYSKELPEFDDDDGEETELSAEEMGLILIEGEELELLEPLQEQLMMAMPIQPICRNECKGLCPICGCNLNTATCQCVEEKFDTRFDALKNFKINK